MRPDNFRTLVAGDLRRVRTRLGWLSVGVVVGVGSLVFMLALVAGLQRIVLTRLVRVVPGEVDVVPQSVSLGPLRLDTGHLDEPTLAKLRALPGVTALYRRSRLRIPTQLTAHYHSYNFVTDIIIEGVDEGLLSDEFGSQFTVQPPGQPLPAVLPGAMLDLLNAGLSVHVGGPALSHTALVGIPFDLWIGRSSFHPGNAVAFPAHLIGVSDKVTLSGPTVPYPYLEQWDRQFNGPPLEVYGVVLKLASPQALDAVAAAVSSLGLRMPQHEQAVLVERASMVIQAALFLFSGVLLVVSGVGIVHGLGMMIEEERTDIGLMRALGARRRDVLGIFMARAWTIGVVGATVGLMLGGILVAAVPWLMRRWIPADLQPIMALTLANSLGPWLFGVLASGAAGYLPARRAATLEPVEALRR